MSSPQGDEPEIDCTDTALQLAAPILTQHVLLRSTCSDETITDFLANSAITPSN